MTIETAGPPPESTADEPPASAWTEVSLRVQPAATEAIAELLQQFTGSGVSIEPPIEALGPDEGYVLDEDAPVLIRGYVYGVVPAGRRSGLRRRLQRAGLLGQIGGRIGWRTIREEDWAEAWKAHYQVQRVGRLVIRPAWRDYEPREAEVVVALDPGMAFGTGQHPTTRMCLELLQEALRGGDRVLDLGSGSGILALAALLLGARAAVAVDIEDQAVAATTANAALNRLQERISVRQGSLNVVAREGPFDLVLANINAATLIALAAGLHRALVPGGCLIASGIIAARAAECLEAFRATGLRLERALEDGDWRAYALRADMRGEAAAG